MKGRSRNEKIDLRMKLDLEMEVRSRKKLDLAIEARFRNEVRSKSDCLIYPIGYQRLCRSARLLIKQTSWSMRGRMKFCSISAKNCSLVVIKRGHAFSTIQVLVASYHSF